MEFEGRTEREAVAKAAAELGSESFDVEVLERKGGFWGKGKVRISVRRLSVIPDPMESRNKANREKTAAFTGTKKTERSDVIDRNWEVPPKKLLKGVTEFTEGVIKRMGYPGEVKLRKQDEKKLIFEIVSPHSNILIGKKGRNLDSLQLLVNAYIGNRVGEDEHWRIVLDIEGYRDRRERSLIRMAHRKADYTAKNGSSSLLVPLNSFERRLIHTEIGNRGDVITQSEGTGLFKRIRILPGKADNK